ncbi:3-oxoacyl-[acyl-carrier-protein] synthase III C-terminal domain-containing protein [Azospirillum cavernae]|uniref:3-oxoacyl-[acyl-carrier-protein] synthase III C-terminal domain-containing protein n=1 Tax=Azospirillum cavernae TaxID=2320860 RepID=UPI001EE6163C|nr:3-oxoacyl-[acyl-carrier-protein] synthase III C-terminal domain-containing protein [Azospirillum cavernae]
MLEHLRKRVQIPVGKFVIDMHGLDNTSCASIPLAICHSLSDNVASGTRRMLMAGFGVGCGPGAPWWGRHRSNPGAVGGGFAGRLSDAGCVRREDRESQTVRVLRFARSPGIQGRSAKRACHSVFLRP